MESLLRHECAALLAENAALRTGITNLEARLALAERTLEHIPDVVARFDPALHYVSANPAISRIVEVSPDACIGKTNRELGLPNRLVDPWDQALQQVFADSQPMRVILDCPGPTGERQYEMDLVPERAPDGTIAAVLCVAHDVTARVQLEHALREEQRLLHGILEYAPATILVKDRDGRFQLVSRRLLTSLGMTHAEELIGKTDADILPPDICAMHQVDDRHIMATGVALLNDYNIPVGDMIHQVMSIGFPLYDVDGTISAVGYISINITERKQAEAALIHLTSELEARVADRTARLTETIQRLEREVAERVRTEAALRESQRFVEQIAAVLPVSLCVYDFQNRQVVYANPQCKAVLGHSMLAHPEPTLTDIVAMLRPDEQTVATMRSRVAALDDDAVFEYEYRVHHDGGLRWLMIRGVVFVRSPEGRVVQVLITVLDVTARRQLEEELRASNRRLIDVQEAERAHIARELHDEIGQVLTGLNLALEVAVHADPTTIQQQIRRAQALVNDTTSRVRQLSFDLRPTILDDLGLLAALAWLVNRYADQTGVHVTMQHAGLDMPFAPEIALTAYRVVQEALTNVARHADVRAAALQLWTTAETLYVQVTDHGRGFDVAAVLGAHRSSGLTGMHERVRLLGGTLTIDATPEVGTRVIAELPLH